MKATTGTGLLILLACCAAWPSQALAEASSDADVISAANQAYQRRDYADVINQLLPLEQSGRLKTAEPLMWLALSCEQAKLPPRNKPHACHKRRVEIMLEAAEMGNPYAMYGASIGLLDTGLGRFGIRLPFADDGKRVDALMWALLAADLTSDQELRARATGRAQQLARSMQREWRGQETLAQRAMRQAKAKRANFQVSPKASAATGGTGRWLDAAALRKPHAYRASGADVVVDALDWTDQAAPETDEGVPPSIDRASIARNGDRIQYVYSEMDATVLIQARCDDGSPTLIWDGDFDPGHPDDSNRWIFNPSWQQPIPRDRDMLDYYRTITRKACKLAAD